MDAPNSNPILGLGLTGFG
ncbi:unnamed protein product, partial [Rotaria sp. Silwood1]